MTLVIDADTHIAEPPQMWEHLEPGFYDRRPLLIQIPGDTVYGHFNAMWLIDGSIVPKAAGRASNILVTPTLQDFVQKNMDVTSRDMTDLNLRFSHMDFMGTDVQVVYPTLFLAWLTDDPTLEVALAQAYNRHLAGISDRSEGRIRWALVPPLRDIDATVREMHFGAEHGAVGLFFRGIEKDLMLDDPYFFPVYEEAQAMGLTICVHQGQGAPALNNLVDIRRSSSFTHGRLPPLSAFRNLVANRIPEEFPRLRFGFIETGASWVPFVFHCLRTLSTEEPWRWGPRLFEQYNMWVSYEVDEDLPYLVDYIGEDHIVVGTDYGHHGREGVIADPSAQLHMVKTLRSREEYPSALIDKLLSDNPRALYGI